MSRHERAQPSRDGRTSVLREDRHAHAPGRGGSPQPVPESHERRAPESRDVHRHGSGAAPTRRARSRPTAPGRRDDMRADRPGPTAGRRVLVAQALPGAPVLAAPSCRPGDRRRTALLPARSGPAPKHDRPCRRGALRARGRGRRARPEKPVRRTRTRLRKGPGAVPPAPDTGGDAFLRPAEDVRRTRAPEPSTSRGRPRRPACP